MIDACCLLCLCFTGSWSHYSDITALMPSMIPNLSSWFPVGGSCPATTFLLHHPCLCLHVYQCGDGGLSKHTNLSRVSPSLCLSCNHHCADLFFLFCWMFSANQMLSSKAQVTNMNSVIRSEAQAGVFPVLDMKDYCCIVYHTAPKCGV